MMCEDSLLTLGDDIECISFHSGLNVFLVTTSTGQLRVFDSTSYTKLYEVQYDVDGELMHLLIKFVVNDEF